LFGQSIGQALSIGWQSSLASILAQSQAVRGTQAKLPILCFGAGVQRWQEARPFRSQFAAGPTTLRPLRASEAGTLVR
jgi:hypothetical protein